MNKEQFNEKMIAVAKILDLSWKPRPEFHDNIGNLNGPEQVCTHVRNGVYSYREEGKITFCSVYPRDAKGQYWAGEKERVNIGVSEAKTPEQIAQDIQRRFLPKYLEHLATMRRKINELNQYNAKKEAALKQVADHFGLEIRDDKNTGGIIYPHLPGLHSVEAYNNQHVKIARIECTPDQAVRIIVLLTEAKDE